MSENHYPSMMTQAEPGREPDGELVAYFQNRDEMQHAFKRLAEANFPMQTLFVVGRNITQVEYLGGRITWPRVILSSAISGAFFGAMIGFVSAVFTGTSVLPHLLSSVPLGIVLWVLTGLWSFSRTQEKVGGAFAMTAQTIPGSLELRAHFSTVEQARQILGVGAYRQQSNAAPGVPNFPGAPVQAASALAQPAGSVPMPPASAVPASPEEAVSFVGPEYNQDGSKAGAKFGLRIEDAGEYQATVRQQPKPDESVNERIQKIREEQNQQRYGIRVDDPEEYQKTIRQAPERSDD